MWVHCCKMILGKLYHHPALTPSHICGNCWNLGRLKSRFWNFLNYHFVFLISVLWISTWATECHLDAHSILLMSLTNGKDHVPRLLLSLFSIKLWKYCGTVETVIHSRFHRSIYVLVTCSVSGTRDLASELLYLLSSRRSLITFIIISGN